LIGALGGFLLALAVYYIGEPTFYHLEKKVYTEEEKNRLVQEALTRSRNVLKGEIGENIAPHMKEFTSKYDPADARYLGGKPVDYIVYKGYSRVYDTDEPIDGVVFVEVKSSKDKKRGLDRNEAKIRDAIDARRVSHDVVVLSLD